MSAANNPDDALEVAISIMGEYGEVEQKIVAPHTEVLVKQYQAALELGAELGLQQMFDAFLAVIFSVFAQGYKQAQADAVKLDPDVWSE